MTLPRIFTISLRLGAAALLSASALTACSTISGMSPFSSNVPYSQDIKPTLPQPAQVEIPAFKPVPPPPPKPKPVEPPPAPEAPPAQAQATPAPAASTPATPAPAAETPPAPPPPAAAAPAPATPSPAPQSSAPEAAPAPKVAVTAPAAAPAHDKTEPAKTADAGSSGETDTDSAPQLPAEHKQFKDDGTYPSLAQVPARPKNMPTFADAKALESRLAADNGTAKTASPASANAPSVDSSPEKAPAAGAPQTLQTASLTPAGAVARPEDKSPCLGPDTVTGDLTTTVHFAPGSAAMTSASLEGLAEAMPTLRGAKGTIRLFGHGDTDANAQASAGRFDLAAARAGAVAQALTGFGVPAAKIAVGVGCHDAATAGASVQLYAES
jgi:outer membrane protein OmpA-like peptidoglycan-associated protein